MVNALVIPLSKTTTITIINNISYNLTLSAGGWINDSIQTRTNLSVNVSNNITAEWCNAFVNASNIQNAFWARSDYTDSNISRLDSRITSVNSSLQTEISLQSANNATQATQISNEVALQSANNATQASQISALTTNLNNVNTTANIQSLGFNTTSQLNNVYAENAVAETINGNWIFTPSTNVTFSSGNVIFMSPAFFYNNVTITNANEMLINDSIILKNAAGTIKGNWSIRSDATVADFSTTGNGVFGQNLNVDTNVLVVDGSTNRVGINMTSPSATLHVGGETIFENPAYGLLQLYRPTNANGASAVIRFYADNGLSVKTNTGSIDVVNTENSSSADIRFSTRINNTVAERMRIDTLGRVGIGATSPATPLEVDSTNGTIVRILATSNNNARFNIGSDDGLTMFMRTDVSSGARPNIVLGGSSNDVFLNVTSHNLGIGVGFSLPQAPLHAYGSTFPVAIIDRSDAGTNLLASALAIRHTTSGVMANNFGAGLIFQIQDNDSVANNAATIYAIRSGSNDNTSDMVFATSLVGSSTERMRITSAGYMGIGTSAPSTQLHTTGNVSLATSSGNIGIGGTPSAAFVDIQPPSMSGTPLYGSLRIRGYTFTDTNTSQNGTATSMLFNAIGGAPTINAATTNVTITNAANVYIATAPANTSNVTLTNTWALWIDAGNSRFDGNVGIGTTTTPSSALQVVGSANITTSITTPKMIFTNWTSTNSTGGLYCSFVNTTSIVTIVGAC